MKRILLIQFLLLTLGNANAQNEFAATAFYTEFKKIYEDAQAGFGNCKGDQRKTGIEGLFAEYKLKCILPLSDSSKLVIPVKGNSYAIYYFEPDKMRLKVDQRSLNLREAITTSFGKPLYVRTETSIVNNQPFSSTLYYDDPGMTSSALFHQLIYFNAGKYYLSLEIRGKKQ